jgi:N-acetylmuramoyl-L-alanine amidase
MLAESVRSMIASTLQKENDRQCKRATSSIYLLHHLEMPAILVECGFLSNPEEAALLANEDYPRTLARLLFLAIMEYQT